MKKSTFRSALLGSTIIIASGCNLGSTKLGMQEPQKKATKLKGLAANTTRLNLTEEQSLNEFARLVQDYFENKKTEEISNISDAFKVGTFDKVVKTDRNNEIKYEESRLMISLNNIANGRNAQKKKSSVASLIKDCFNKKSTQ